MAEDKTKKTKGGTSPSGSESLGLLDDVAAHDFDAASPYLSLKLGEKTGGGCRRTPSQG